MIASKYIWLFLIVITLARIADNLTSREHYSEGEHVVLSGRIMSEPVLFDTSIGIELQEHFIYVPKYPEVSYWDTISIQAIVKEGKLMNAKVLSHTKSNSVLLTIRKKLIDVIKVSLPADEGGLTAGVTLGTKMLISRDFWENVKKTGTAHVVVASGTNVVLVSSFLINFLTWFVRRRYAVYCTFVGIIMYAALVGFDPPIIRASIMAMACYVFQLKGRVYTPFSVLLFVGLCMLFFVPTWIKDVGFYLSFMATLGLMTLQNKIERYLKIVPSFIRSDLATTLSAQIAVSPILLFFFGSVNILSVVINSLVLWTVVPITIIGFIGSTVGLFLPSIGEGILLISYPFAWWFVMIVNIFA